MKIQQTAVLLIPDQRKKDEQMWLPHKTFLFIL